MDEMEMWEINESFCRACKDASYGQMNLSKIRKYLEDGANPNYRTKYDMCALDWSICCDVDGTIFNNGGLLDLLVEFGADVNTKDNCGRPLLFSTSSAEGVEAVLRHGAIADLTDKEGNTALFHHASEGNSEAVKLLLNHGV
ncbi:MAG TPA: ankyrin repeat domain-containing protein, partial [Anaerovoracaceae bacterium]|nr:ankyrin repeat domain-containing protein [Anaerovoracaceae bacterium]